ncbi:hypothetical protein KEM48_013675 [Puccinia striiformis f. sp. tritici PST-130]|nr:hypothetical protein KEM48_013675 [Puccinia striiformis f. sp. tritici PST-130]
MNHAPLKIPSRLANYLTFPKLLRIAAWSIRLKSHVAELQISYDKDTHGIIPKRKGNCEVLQLIKRALPTSRFNIDTTSEDEISFRASGIDEQAYLPTYHHLAAHRVGCLRLVCRRWAKFLYDTMYFGLTFYSTSQAVAFAKYARKNPQCLRRIKCRYLMFHNVPEAITYKAMRMVIRLLSQTIDTLHIVFSELAAALSDQTGKRGSPITHLIATAWYYDLVGLSKALRPTLKVLSLEDNSYAIDSHALEPVYSNLEEVLKVLRCQPPFLTIRSGHHIPTATRFRGLLGGRSPHLHYRELSRKN